MGYSEKKKVGQGRQTAYHIYVPWKYVTINQVQMKKQNPPALPIPHRCSSLVPAYTNI